MQQYFGIKKEKNVIILNDEDTNHIKNVMRMKTNDEILVVFNKKRYLGKLNEDFKSVRIINKEESKNKNNEIIFYVPIVQEDKMNLVLQKGTELGVTRFIPVEYEHCKFKIKSDQKAKKILRWNKIIKSACEQSHRLDIPKLENIITTKEIVKGEGVNIMCSLDKTDVKPVKQVLTTNNVYDTINVLYGPEGGFAKREEDFFESLGYTKTSLGDTILRTETVIIYVSSIILYLKSGE